MCSKILEGVTCENTACKLNLCGSCQNIGTLLFAESIGGLPGPLSCDEPVYDGNIETYYAY